MRKYLQIVNRHKASFGSRLTNYFLDRFFIYVIFYAAIFLFGIFYVFVFGEDIDSEKIEDDDAINLAFVFMYLLFSFLYFYLMEYYYGRTIAKYITGTKVISIDGNPPTSKQIIARTFSRAVPFNAWSFLGENGWHDSWSETRVINIKNYESERQAKEDINSLGTKEIV